jgi:hypothetical protein
MAGEIQDVVSGKFDFANLERFFALDRTRAGTEDDTDD